MTPVCSNRAEANVPYTIAKVIVFKFIRWIINDLSTLCSNGISHRVDDAEFDDAAVQMSSAAEVAEPQEMTQEQVPLSDDNMEQMVLPDEDVKAAEDNGGSVAVEQEPMVDESQEEMTSEQERVAETDEVEPEVEGIHIMLFTWLGG